MTLGVRALQDRAETNAFFDNAIKGVPVIFQKELLKFGLRVENNAKRIVPVDTGRLRSSIYAEMINENLLFVGSNVQYAEYVEYGTIHMMPKPYLRPAIFIAEQNFEPEVSKELANAFSWSIK